MCGIAGIISKHGLTRPYVKKMSGALSHRGPDDEGCWHGHGVTLLHRRLSIVDIEGGHQPMVSDDGNLVVTFNGEIYNYEDLRAQLEAKGRLFRTKCDTEVLLHLYSEYGLDFVTILRGMFSFAIWDASKKRMLLARDHLGQKPLFYYHCGETFAFASEMKSLLASGVVSAEVNVDTLWHHTGLRFCPHSSTLLRGVRKLPPGHMILLEADSDFLQITRYWQLDYSRKLSLSFAEAADELESLLDDTTKLHLMGDVPIGGFLSGGVDSSLVSALAAKHVQEEFSTFSVGVRDSDFSELPFARQAAGTIKSRHHEYQVKADLILLLPDILWHLEEPADSHAVGLYLLSRLARPHVKVVLGGDGADETFGGYVRFTQSRIISAYSLIPKTVRTGLIGPILKHLPHSYSFYSIANKSQWAQNMSLLKGAERHFFAMTFFGFTGDDRDQLFSPEARQKVDDADTFHWISDHFDGPLFRDDIDRVFYTEQVTRMPEHFLQIADRMSMAHGLEMRSPFVDWRVAQFSAGLPSHYKVRTGQLKVILREVARRHFPAKLIDRPKMGFKFPMARWFRDDLADFVTGALSEARIFEAGLFNREFVNHLLAEHKSGRVDHNFKIWNLLNFEIWYRLFISGDTRDQVRDWLAKLLGSPTHRLAPF